MVWCGSCYIKGTSDIFKVNDPIYEDRNLLYDFESDAYRYTVEMDGSHHMGPFQCDLCVLHTLYHRKSRKV